ncbi:MAG: C2H2-type zinc finger protein [Nitrososphaeraceae archaeon]
MIGQVLEGVTGKNMSTTINFQNLEIDIPKAQDADGRDLGTAKWTLNGIIVWTTELHKTEEIDGRSASISKGVMSDESTPVSASFSCDFCNKGFSSREELKQHTRQEHSR